MRAAKGKNNLTKQRVKPGSTTIPPTTTTWASGSADGRLDPCTTEWEQVRYALDVQDGGTPTA